MTSRTSPGAPATLKEKLFGIIFESDTPAGRLFDKLLITAILVSVLVVMLDSVGTIAEKYHRQLTVFEWVFTALFTAEYALRLYCSKNRLRYATSFYGVIDLLAVLPTYLALLFPEIHALIDVRVLRLIRIFRIFKLTEYISEYTHLASALQASKRKILVFLSVVLMIVMVMGTIMYVVEGPENGFTSIPIAIYWAITTMTTVGFGDITPKTDLGRLISSIMMLMGWGTLAVPTGIVTSEMALTRRILAPMPTRVCNECLAEGLDHNDQFCRHCGSKL